MLLLTRMLISSCNRTGNFVYYITAAHLSYSQSQEWLSGTLHHDTAARDSVLARDAQEASRVVDIIFLAYALERY